MDAPSVQMVRDRIVDLLMLHLGRAEEELTGSGLIDSVRAISFALTLEEEFGVTLDEVTVEDMVTLSGLSNKLHTIIARNSEAGESSSPPSIAGRSLTKSGCAQ